MSKNRQKGQGKKTAPQAVKPKKAAQPAKNKKAKGPAPKKVSGKKNFNFSLAVGTAFGGAFVALGLYGAIGQGNAGGYYIAALGLLVFGAIAWVYRH